MLERTEEFARPGLQFKRGDLAELEGKWDLVFSNAALHWSTNHGELIPHLFDCLNPGGQLAVQVPSNHNSTVHRTIIEVAKMEPFVSVLKGWYREAPVLPIEVYAELLFQEEAQDILVFEKVYPHVMENVDAVVDWISGTALIPYFDRLGQHKDNFVVTLRQSLGAVMPGSPVFHPFRRTFFSARKAK
jgi:trans-aconitate 2-methyltransferase